MTAVYPWLRTGLRFPALVALASLLLAGCAREPAHDPVAAPEPRSRPQQLSQLVASRSYRAVALSATGDRLLAQDSDGRTLLFDFSGASPRTIFEGEAIQPLGLDPEGETIVASEWVGPASPHRRRLLGADRHGARTPLRLELEEPRFLGFGENGNFSAAARSPEGGGLLLEISARTGLARTLASFPAGFAVAAVSADGSRLALRRALHPEADEVYLFERATSETRLLLPDASDARFLPVAFDGTGSQLVLLSDDGTDDLHLERLDLGTGRRSRVEIPVPDAAAAPGDPGVPPLDLARCGVVQASISAPAVMILELNCGGARILRELALEGTPPPPLPQLPPGTRRVARILASRGGVSVAIDTVASPRLPRDLLRQPGNVLGPVLEPLTWGLSPGVDPETLLDSTLERIPVETGPPLPVEIWHAGKRGAGGGPVAGAGLLWIEGDDSAPGWKELDPLFQFLATRGVVVVRMRLRGAEGFGRAFRHAADGRLFEAALADLAAAARWLTARGADPARIALAAEGGWPGAIAAAVAHRSTAAAGADPFSLPFPFAAVASAGAHPDPLGFADSAGGLSEPARSWWLARLGDPASEELARARNATSAISRSAGAPVSAYYAVDRPGFDPIALWDFLEPRLSTGR